MNEVTIFLLGIALTLLSSTAVVVYLRRYLHKVLVDLCGTEERAQFWTAFTNILLILIPLIVAMFIHPEGQRDESVFFRLASQLKWSLSGLVAALVLIGLFITAFAALAAPRRS
jgi:hypothetical protein